MMKRSMMPLILAAVPALGGEAPPIACQAHALSEAERDRQRVLLDAVRRAVTSVLELEDGYALSLPADPALFRDLAEWVGLERRCCPFAAFALEWSDRDRVTVRVTGAPGVKELLAAEGLGAGIGPGR